MCDLNTDGLIIAFIGFLGAIIGAIVGGTLSYYGSYKLNEKQLKYEQKNIAKSIDVDLKNVSEYTHFNEYYKFHKNDDLEKEESLLLDIKLPENLFDDQNLLYFVFNKDITKLEYNISLEIHEFYNDLFKAEEYRKFVKENQYLDYRIFQANPDFQTKIFERAKEMKALVIKCGNKITEIRVKLEKVYGLWVFDYLYRNHFKQVNYINMHWYYLSLK